MRIAVGMLICLGGLSAAWAEPPSPSPAAAPPPVATDQGKPAPSDAPSSVSGATTAPAGADPASVTASKSVNSSTAAAAAPANAAAQPAKPTELTADEKSYLSHGYKLQIRGGEKYFCRSEQQLGTRFATTTCRTAEQMAASAQTSKDFATEMERPNGNKPGR